MTTPQTEKGSVPIDPYCPDHGHLPTAYDECSCVARARQLKRQANRLTRAERESLARVTGGHIVPLNNHPCITCAIEAEAGRIAAERSAAALREAAADARGMHDPATSDCIEWAEWLEARADRLDSEEASNA